MTDSLKAHTVYNYCKLFLEETKSEVNLPPWNDLDEITKNHIIESITDDIKQMQEPNITLTRNLTEFMYYNLIEPNLFN